MFLLNGMCAVLCCAVPVWRTREDGISDPVRYPERERRFLGCLRVPLSAVYQMQVRGVLPALCCRMSCMVMLLLLLPLLGAYTGLRP